MSAGDTLWVLRPGMESAPDANYAEVGTIVELSTPGVQIPCWLFDGAADEHIDFHLTIPSNYDSTTGFRFSYKFVMDGVDGDIVELEFRVLDIVQTDDLDTDLGIDTQTALALQDDPGVTAYEMFVSGTGDLAKANFGTALAHSAVILRVTRDISAATNTDDMAVLEFLVEEY